MQRLFRRDVSGWCGLVGAVSALIATMTLSGCPGTLDPEIVKMLGSGGSGSGNGGSGSGGSGSGGSGSGGSTGTGGTSTNVSCTGDLDPGSILTNNCAFSGCHIPGGDSAGSCGGLDLTPDSNIGSRLVGVAAGTSAEGSKCTGMGPYLDAKSNPATGLLLDKVKGKPACGVEMPDPGPPLVAALTADQLTCIESWAEGLITAAQ